MAKFEEIMLDEGFMRELSKQTTKEDVISLFAKKDIVLTDEDYEGLTEMLKSAIQEEGEINEDELDAVVGGAWYKYKCSCGDKFATEWFANFHAVRKNAKKIFCGDGGFTFCTTDGHTHTVKRIK